MTFPRSDIDESPPRRNQSLFERLRGEARTLDDPVEVEGLEDAEETRDRRPPAPAADPTWIEGLLGDTQYEGGVTPISPGERSAFREREAEAAYEDLLRRAEENDLSPSQQEYLDRIGKSIDELDNAEIITANYFGIKDEYPGLVAVGRVRVPNPGEAGRNFRRLQDVAEEAAERFRRASPEEKAQTRRDLGARTDDEVVDIIRREAAEFDEQMALDQINSVRRSQGKDTWGIEDYRLWATEVSEEAARRGVSTQARRDIQLPQRPPPPRRQVPQRSDLSPIQQTLPPPRPQALPPTQARTPQATTPRLQEPSVPAIGTGARAARGVQRSTQATGEGAAPSARGTGTGRGTGQAQAAGKGTGQTTGQGAGKGTGKTPRKTRRKPPRTRRRRLPRGSGRLPEDETTSPGEGSRHAATIAFDEEGTRYEHSLHTNRRKAVGKGTRPRIPAKTARISKFGSTPAPTRYITVKGPDFVVEDGRIHIVDTGRRLRMKAM